MSILEKLQFIKDPENKTITVIRYFDATPDLVWKAWTEPELLDLWWAPRPWKTETLSMDFRHGGKWFYAMVGPEGERHHCYVSYEGIDPGVGFHTTGGFCDVNGNPSDQMPGMEWKCTFHAEGDGTIATINIEFESTEALKTIVEMGFQEGFTSAMTNLDQYLSAHFKLRREMKSGNGSRVATYLNFPGNTEEAFNFYKEIFNGTFGTGGMQRFGDFEIPDAPPISEEDKKLILHVELTIMGGHVLMATDAPESMGFKVEPGNNMHINIEPESRQETDRIFNALSQGGKITMPLQDMFWGAYYGSLTDKYGINWMLNFQAAQ